MTKCSGNPQMSVNYHPEIRMLILYSQIYPLLENIQSHKEKKVFNFSLSLRERWLQRDMYHFHSFWSWVSREAPNNHMKAGRKLYICFWFNLNAFLLAHKQLQESVVSVWYNIGGRIISTVGGYDWCLLLLKTTLISAETLIPTEELNSIIMNNQTSNEYIVQVMWLYAFHNWFYQSLNSSGQSHGKFLFSLWS